MDLMVIDKHFSICQVTSFEQVDWSREFCFVAKTDQERSVVCETAHVPSGAITRDDNWRAIRVMGVLDFSLVGILAALAGILAEADIAIFALSTYNTDYILVKQHHLDRALDVLSARGHTIVRTVP
ncbi:MAG: ACT domain-containing protein [Clostridiaceae bacterium]|nr:ACT domain-containing protein [Clostridiaceae bacterium]